MVRTNEQLRLALAAPPRPQYADAQGDNEADRLESWRSLRRDWVATWQGKAPPEVDSEWRRWWDRAGEQHRKLVAAAHSRFGAEPGAAAPDAASEAAGTPAAAAGAAPAQLLERRTY